MNLYLITGWFIIIILFCPFIIYAVYQIKKYMQIGDTCGFYSLVYAASKMLHINKKKMIRKIIMESIDAKESYVGEIFDLKTMKKIGKHYFPELEIDILSVSSIGELDSLLVGHYVILPCLYKNIPHYVFLEGTEGENYLYRSCVYKVKKEKKQKFFLQNNAGLCENSLFDWKLYYDKSQKESKHILTALVSLLLLANDSKLYQFLRRNKLDKKDYLIHQEKYTKVDMAGRVITIKKQRINNQDRR